MIKFIKKNLKKLLVGLITSCACITAVLVGNNKEVSAYSLNTNFNVSLGDYVPLSNHSDTYLLHTNFYDWSYSNNSDSDYAGFELYISNNLFYNIFNQYSYFNITFLPSTSISLFLQEMSRVSFVEHFDESLNNNDYYLYGYQKGTSEDLILPNDFKISDEFWSFWFSGNMQHVYSSFALSFSSYGSYLNVYGSDDPSDIDFYLLIS